MRRIRDVICQENHRVRDFMVLTKISALYEIPIDDLIERR